MNVDTGTPEESVLGSAWLSTVSASCERVCNALAASDRADAGGLLRTFTHTLPRPGGPAESIVLRGLLLAVAVRASAILHGRMHPNTSTPCNLPLERMLDALANGPPDAALTAFAAWQETFLGALDSIHPPTLGSSIGVLVRRDFQRGWSLRVLANHFKTTPAQVRRSFELKFGRSVHDYQQLARVVAALEDMRSAATKIDAVALSVGYHSKKNFYTAFRRLIGRTPNEYRRLPDTEASLLKERAREELGRGALPRKPLRES